MNNSNHTGINRIIKQTDYQFTMIPNQAVRDPEITSNAFRLLAYLLSHENGYELLHDQIMRQTDLGRYAAGARDQKATREYAAYMAFEDLNHED